MHGPNYILITRPGSLGQQLCRNLEQQGINSLWLPTIEFTPPTDLALTARQLQTANTFDWLIFISQQAVISSMRYLPISLTCKIASIGKSTTKLLQHNKIKVTADVQATNAASENFLKLAQFQHVAQQKIAIIKGAGGRELLTQTLRTRKALVTEIIVYTRKCPKINNKKLYQDLLQQQKIASILITSITGLENLISILGQENRKKLCQTKLIVISQRLYVFAKNLGFKTCYIAQSAAESDIISIFKKI